MERRVGSTSGVRSFYSRRTPPSLRNQAGPTAYDEAVEFEDSSVIASPLNIAKFMITFAAPQSTCDETIELEYIGSEIFLDSKLTFTLLETLLSGRCVTKRFFVRKGVSSLS